MTYSAVLLNGDVVGPVTPEQLQDFASRGYLSPESMLKDEAGHEVRADSVGLTFPEAVTETAAKPSVDPPQGEPPPSASSSPSAASAKPFPWMVVTIVVAGVAVFGCVILAAILFPVFSQAKSAAKQTETMSRLKQISTALSIYLVDSELKFPPDMSSGAAIQPYLRTYSRDVIFESLNPNGKELLGNALLAGKDSLAMPDQANTMTLFDSADWPNKTRITALVDGSVRKVKSAEYEAATGRGFVLR